MTDAASTKDPRVPPSGSADQDGTRNVPFPHELRRVCDRLSEEAKRLCPYCHGAELVTMNPSERAGAMVHDDHRPGQSSPKTCFAGRIPVVLCALQDGRRPSAADVRVAMNQMCPRTCCWGCRGDQGCPSRQLRNFLRGWKQDPGGNLEDLLRERLEPVIGDAVVEDLTDTLLHGTGTAIPAGLVDDAPGELEPPRHGGHDERRCRSVARPVEPRRQLAYVEETTPGALEPRPKARVVALHGEAGSARYSYGFSFDVDADATVEDVLPVLERALRDRLPSRAAGAAAESSDPAAADARLANARRQVDKLAGTLSEIRRALGAGEGDDLVETLNAISRRLFAGTGSIQDALDRALDLSERRRALLDQSRAALGFGSNHDFDELPGLCRASRDAVRSGVEERRKLVQYRAEIRDAARESGITDWQGWDELPAAIRRAGERLQAAGGDDPAEAAHAARSELAREQGQHSDTRRTLEDRRAEIRGALAELKAAPVTGLVDACRCRMRELERAQADQSEPAAHLKAIRTILHMEEDSQDDEEVVLGVRQLHEESEARRLLLGALRNRLEATRDVDLVARAEAVMKDLKRTRRERDRAEKAHEDLRRNTDASRDRYKALIRAHLPQSVDHLNLPAAIKRLVDQLRLAELDRDRLREYGAAWRQAFREDIEKALPPDLRRGSIREAVKGLADRHLFAELERDRLREELAALKKIATGAGFSQSPRLDFEQRLVNERASNEGPAIETTVESFTPEPVFVLLGKLLVRVDSIESVDTWPEGCTLRLLHPDGRREHRSIQGSPAAVHAAIEGAKRDARPPLIIKGGFTQAREEAIRADADAAGLRVVFLPRMAELVNADDVDADVAEVMRPLTLREHLQLAGTMNRCRFQEPFESMISEEPPLETPAGTEVLPDWISPIGRKYFVAADFADEPDKTAVAIKSAPLRFFNPRDFCIVTDPLTGRTELEHRGRRVPPPPAESPAGRPS